MADIKLPDIVNPEQLSKDDEGNGGINIGHFWGVKKNQSKLCSEDKCSIIFLSACLVCMHCFLSRIT